MIHPDLLNLLFGVGAILVVASAVGYVLQRRLSPDGQNSAVENLNDRIRAWWVMAVLLAIAFIGGRAGVVLLFGFCSFAALREFVTLTNASRADHWSLVASFFIVLPFQYYLVRVAEVQWALMICVFCASHVPALLNLDIPGFEGRNVFLIAFLIVVVQLSDVLQYVWGKLLGRHKIAPRLSPSKTVEGFAGGIASATLVGAGLWWMTPFTMLEAALLALVITLSGFFGGLVMSAIKRDRGVKDWGSVIAGHGGFIDRLDSVVFSAPIFFHIVRYFWTVD